MLGTLSTLWCLVRLYAHAETATNKKVMRVMLQTDLKRAITAPPLLGSS
jgi:hypothetical protein